MSTNIAEPKMLALLAAAWISFVPRLGAQTAPTVINQPTSQTASAGSVVSFSVNVAGTGPFGYIWQLNGTNLPNNIITTVVGTGAVGYTGDNGPATNASLKVPSGIAFDTAGNLYIADGTNAVVRRVDTSGIITTVAGNGKYGYSGDGGPATNASLGYLNDVKAHASGDLYIADGANQRIRKVATNGIISTVAGNGYLFHGAGTYGGDGGPATNASLNNPSGLALDTLGNLYIADTSNQRIREVSGNGIITTVAGTNLTGFSGDGGPATNASLNYPAALAFDSTGNLYLTDSANERIRKVDTNGIITTVAGNGSRTFSGDGGPATNASLDLTVSGGLAFDALGNLYLADQGNERIRKVDSSGVITTVTGGYYPLAPQERGSFSGDGGAATNARLNSPAAVAVDPSGNLYLADTANQRIREVLLYSTYRALTLENVSATSAGSYTVAITSPFGSITSAVATLSVGVTAPQIVTTDGQFGFLTNHFGFNITAPVGATVVVDGSSDLVLWTPLLTNTIVTTPLYFFDPSPTNASWRFYRARLP